MHLPQGAQAEPVIAAWRAQAVMTLQSTTAPVATPWAALAGRPALTVFQATGKNPRGQAVQARWTWVQRGQDVYHWALYAPVVRTDMEEPFFAAMQWP
jgi:hypothetical protein